MSCFENLKYVKKSMTYLQHVLSDMIHHWRYYPYFNDKENLSLLRLHFFALILGTVYDWFKYTHLLFHDNSWGPIINWIDFVVSLIFLMNNEKFTIFMMSLYISTYVPRNRYWFFDTSFSIDRIINSWFVFIRRLLQTSVCIFSLHEKIYLWSNSILYDMYERYHFWSSVLWLNTKD